MQEGWYDDRPRSFLVYAPSRTAVVYALVEDEPEAVGKPEPVQKIETVEEEAEAVEALEPRKESEPLEG